MSESEIFAQSAVSALKLAHRTQNQTHVCYYCKKICQKPSKRPFKCKECYKRFNQRSILNIHSLRHQGFKPKQPKLCLQPAVHTKGQPVKSSETGAFQKLEELGG
ncbi:hypothetical protein HELRODRAFT_163946 [Helobdella robusta]|uniref:C2H2-type domain-containing protein n=1 Tax=Helobdella robusta TaxID=6412 RepID=T1EUN1_HELRO|nr:hypothetical protein HELRODRAFT_163946 [Helobdella robusta]ESN94162.1 hypothetical protein HELRODRAFT_163946 [Helobdella robusta]